jgi:hypothetical protein
MNVVLGERGSTARSRRRILAGVVGSLALIAGVALYLAMVDPTYGADEPSHVGHVLSLREGELPSLSTPIETADGGEHLRAAVRRPWAARTTYSANNPPFVYLVSLPFVELAIRSGITDGPLLAIRFLDVVGACVAVALAYFLGRELSGGDRFIGLVTAGLLSSSIAVGKICAGAMLDGPALAATTGVTWMLARFARTRSMRDATWLGCWSAAAAAVRPMSLAFAAIAGALALILGVRALGKAALIPLLIRLAAPAMLLTAWFYFLNVYRYGDPTGAAGGDELNVPGFHRVSLLTSLRSPNVTVRPFAYLIMGHDGNPFFWYRGSRAYVVAALAVGLVVAAVVIAAQRSKSTRKPVFARYEPSSSAWICVAALFFVPFLINVKYVADGGGAQPRYLLPMLPVIAAAAALVATWMNRWVAVAVTGLLGVAHVASIRDAPPLRDALLPQPFLALSASLAVVGVITLLICLIRVAASPATRGEEGADWAGEPVAGGRLSIATKR